MTTGIYTITNIRNGKMYVGSAVDYTNRISRHRRELGRGKHHSKKLQHAWDKYGAESFIFEMVWPCDRAYLIFFEQIFIDGNDTVSEGYNVAPKAGSTLGVKHTEETRKVLSALKKGKSSHNAKSLERLKESCRNSWTPEKIEKQRITRTGRKHSEETKAKIRASKVGKPRSDELKAKLSAYRTGCTLSEEHRKAISEGGKRRYREMI